MLIDKVITKNRKGYMMKKIYTLMTLMLFLSVSFLNLDSNSNTALAQEKGMVPGNTLGLKSDADLWSYVRTGKAGSTQMKDELASIMIQSEGDNWRALRNGPVSLYGAFALAGIIGLLVIFYFVRGRITVDSGLSGKTILRFGTIDRFAHWLMAGSFVLLALTGLNLMYGKYFLLPLFGPEIFSAITIGGKYIHNFLGYKLLYYLLNKNNLKSDLQIVFFQFLLVHLIKFYWVIFVFDQDK